MGKIPAEVREAIGRNIRAERLKKYGNRRGTSKQCAKDFDVSPQQWSPWERGMRTPDEIRMKDIAKFFGVNVEYLRRTAEQHIITYGQWLQGVRKIVAEPETPIYPNSPFPSAIGFSAIAGNDTPVEAAGMVLQQKREIEAIVGAIWNMIESGIRVSLVIEKGGEQSSPPPSQP